MKKVLGKASFNFSLSFVFLYLVLLILLISLGFWQLGRADEKKHFIEKQQLATEKAIIKLSSSSDSELGELRFRKTVINGRYDQEHQYLIDNQIVNGKVGYFVMTPFVVDGMKKSVLINRGWVALNKDRRILPKLSIKTTKTSLRGRINTFPSVGIKLAGAEIPTHGWPSVVQVVDVDILSKKLGYSLFSFQVELDDDMNEGYVRAWKKNTIMLPEKHIAYAVQWFGLAITLTLLFIWFSKKDK